MSNYKRNDVVQFTENHKWAACLGIIDEVKELDDDVRYLIGIPIPEGGTAFIFSMESDAEFEPVGTAVLGYADEEDDK
jgi:hypothetical protein